MQTSYTQYNDPGQLGNIADTFHPRQVDSYLAQGVIGIGKAVVLGTAKETATNRGQVVQAGTGVGQGALIIGVTLLSQTLEQTLAGVVQYLDKSAVGVMKKGRVWLETNDAVVAGAVANFHLATGKWTDEVVAAGIEATVLTKARFVTGTTAAGLAIVEFQSQ